MRQETSGLPLAIAAGMLMSACKGVMQTKT